MRLCPKHGSPLKAYLRHNRSPGSPRGKRGRFRKKTEAEKSVKSIGYMCVACFNEKRRSRYKHKQFRPNSPYHRLAERLTDWYVRKTLSGKTKIPGKSWPDALVELKRALILLKRQMWERT